MYLRLLLERPSRRRMACKDMHVAMTSLSQPKGVSLRAQACGWRLLAGRSRQIEKLAALCFIERLATGGLRRAGCLRAACCCCTH
jgi:hypothetical protein